MSKDIFVQKTAMTGKSIIDAASAHVAWKRRLAHLIEGTSYEKFDSESVGRDDQCDLGKWLCTDGLKYQASKFFKELVHEHKRFHTCAAEVIINHEQGNKSGAEAVLDGCADTASRRIIAAAMSLRNDFDGIDCGNDATLGMVSSLGPGLHTR